MLTLLPKLPIFYRMRPVCQLLRPRFRSAVALMPAVFALTAILPVVAGAETMARPFKAQHQAGIRLGGWANLGDSPTASQTSGSASYEVDFKGGAFHFEGFVGIRFSPALMGEFSLGIFNRGDVNLTDGSDQFFASLLVYPLLLKAKVYPLGNSGARIQPYLTAGGGFYYARHDIQFYRSDLFFAGFDTQSATSIEYTLGGGIDLPLASKIGLDLNVAYMPLKFSKDLITIRNYDGLAITLGVKYLFSSLR